MTDSEVKQIDGSNPPFTTTDAELALSLLTAGCRFAPPEAGGPAQMHYTPDTCRNRWVTRKDAIGNHIRVSLLPQQPVSPQEFEIAVMRAVKMEIPGIVTYFLVRDDVFREAMAMHDQLAKKAQEAALSGTAMQVPPLHTLTEAAAIMAICYARRVNQKDMATYAWLRPPNLALGDVKKAVTPKEGVPHAALEQMSYEASGSGKIWSINLSDEKRATIMSDGKPFIHPKPRL